jgi:hypothetical protein
MSTKILLKKSDQEASVPTSGDLDFGELALNYSDGVLYYKKADGTISSISGSSGGGTGVLTRTEFVATQGQTRFFASYTVGSGNYPNAFMYLNGVLLLAGDDYTGTNGVYIDLTDAADEGDVVEVFVYAISSIADALQITSNLADLNDPAVALSNLDANLASFVSAFTLPTSDGTIGQTIITDGAGTLSFGTIEGGGSELPANSIGYLYNDGAGNLTWTIVTVPTDVADLTDTTNLLFDGDYNSLTNTPTIPTDVSDLTDTGGVIPSLTGYATETYVNSAITNLVDTAPTTLDTLNELAAALGDDANFATTVTASLGLKANSADLSTVATSGLYSDLTGTPTIPADVSELTDTTNLLTHFDGDYNSLTNTPTLFDGNYNSLTNTPTIFDGDYSSLTNTPTIFDGDYSSLTNTPTLFDGNYNSLTNTPTIPSVLTDLSIVDGTQNQILTTDGEGIFTFQDAPVSLPDQTGNAGLYLTTDGTTATWDEAPGEHVYVRTTYTATGGQTTFAANYDIGYVDIFLNGIKLLLGTDFTATSGTTVELSSGATAGDIVEILAHSTYNNINLQTSNLINDAGFITESIRYESKVIDSNTTLDENTHYFAGVNTVINNGVTLTIPADTLLEVKVYAAGKPL